MEITEMTLEELISEYQEFFDENLKGDDITEIAYRTKKSTKTISNYIKFSDKAVDYLTMKAIVEIGLEILSKRGIEKI